MKIWFPYPDNIRDAKEFVKRYKTPSKKMNKWKIAFWCCLIILVVVTFFFQLTQLLTKGVNINISKRRLHRHRKRP
jgi:hypothetical protein